VYSALDKRATSVTESMLPELPTERENLLGTYTIISAFTDAFTALLGNVVYAAPPSDMTSWATFGAILGPMVTLQTGSIESLPLLDLSGIDVGSIVEIARRVDERKSVLSPIDTQVLEAFTIAASAMDDEEALDQFSTTIECLAVSAAPQILTSVERLVFDKQLDPSLGLAALRALGRLGPRKAREERRKIAERALRSAVPEHRLGAFDILADTLDKAALPGLERAVAHETIGAIRGDLTRLLRRISES
jgi:hypothetical protein